MRSLISKNKRIKVMVHQRLSSTDSWDEACLEFTEIDRSELVFSRGVPSHQVEKIEFVEIFFKIAGQWKKYKINNLKPIYEYADQNMIRRVSFSFNEEEQNDFDQSFRIARCC